MSQAEDFPFPKSTLTGSSRRNALSQFPQALQELAGEKTYLREYLQVIPTDEIGIPAYYPKLSRELGKLRNRNLIYPIDDGLFVHIYPDPKSERDFWIPIEPDLTVELDGIVRQVEGRLMNLAEVIGQTSEEERKQAFLTTLDRICALGTGEEDLALEGSRLKGKDPKIRVTPRELEALKYRTLRDKVGLGILQPLLLDPYLEDISCSGVGNVFVEHSVFKSLKTTIVFPTLDDLDDFVVWLGERIRKPVTLRHPIVDAVLPDGSRINIVYGRDIAKRGSNFTVRKFQETPLSVLQLIKFGTLNYLMAAYLWMVIEEGLNVFVAGATASGKTTLLNALTTFIRPDAKVVSIEDTPELQVPHRNWIREVVREMSASEKSGAVNMFDLLKAALRQRPDRILIGEIRGVEGNIAFQAMQTGHGVMSTFHAASVERLIQRLTGDPINVPKPYIDNLDVVVIQAAVRGPDGRTVRRVLSVDEMVDYDPHEGTFTFLTAFRWKAENDTFEFPGDMNSYVLEHKIALKRGIPPSKRRTIYSELRRRAAILEKLHNKKGVEHFGKFFEILAEAQRRGLV